MAQTAVRNSRPSGDALQDFVDAAKAAGDQLRAQILRALATESYSVSELCQIFRTAQPALSHHLKVLHQAHLVAKRREGNSIYYHRSCEPHDHLRQALYDAIDRVPLPKPVRRRVVQTHAARHRRSAEFFAENAHRFADRQALISPAGAYADAITDVVEHFPHDQGTLLEVGPGTGEVLEALAPRFRDLIGIDDSSDMLRQAEQRVARLPNVRLQQQDFFALSATGRYDAVVAAMVVHHMPSPQRFFQQARCVLKDGGLLVVAELCRHDHDWVIEACGDTWLGFEASELDAWANKAGFSAAEAAFLGQKNGFQIQIHGYLAAHAIS